MLYYSSHYSLLVFLNMEFFSLIRNKCIFDFSRFLFRYVSSFNLQFSPTEIGWKFSFFLRWAKQENLGRKLKAKETHLYRKSRIYISQKYRSSRHCLHFSVLNKSLDTPLTTRIANLHFRKETWVMLPEILVMSPEKKSSHPKKQILKGSEFQTVNKQFIALRNFLSLKRSLFPTTP